VKRKRFRCDHPPPSGEFAEYLLAQDPANVGGFGLREEHAQRDCDQALG
jgi:hypothetical protein